MAQVPFHNSGSAPVYIRGVCVPPGETRMFEQPEFAEILPATEGDPVAELAAGPVKDILARLAEIDGDAVARLEALELGREAPRKTVLEAIAKRRFDAAQQAVSGER